jgi:ATP-dependent Clp protease protease subunit
MSFYQVSNMTIRVPKVPYRLPGEPGTQWINIFNRLSKERVLFLIQNLEDEIANQLICLLLYLCSENEERDIFLYVNSIGGSFSCSLSLVDTIEYIKPDVNTINVGAAESIASLVVARGRRQKRLALPHAHFLIYQPERSSKGQATRIFYESEEVIRLRRSIRNLYVKFTDKSLSRIAKDLDRGEFMSANQACKYGLIDWVGSRIKSFDFVLVKEEK